MPSRPIHRDPWPLVGLASAIAFVVLGALVVRRGGLPFDAPVTAFVQGLPVPEWFWVACSALGGVTLVVVGTTLVILSAVSGRIRLALIVAVVLIAAGLFTGLVKELVARPRPDGVHLVTATGYSFPSGHSLDSAATYGLLAVVAWRSALPLAARRLAVTAGLVLPLLIGLSRIALGVHYPGDVLAGWLAGTAFVALAATLIRVTGAMERDLPRGPAPPAKEA